jgi:probable F420-dependent oxidoreductase
MRFGVAMPLQVSGVTQEDVRGFVTRAEEKGLDSVWTLDRLVYDSFSPIPALAFAAALTRRVRLGTSILLATLHNPLILAKDLATIDALSGGRLTLGLSVGQREPDFNAAGVSMKGRGRRLEEMLELMKRAWAGEAISYQGRVFQVDIPPTGPRPAQQPHPPLYLGGGSPAALARAARLGDGYVVGGGGPNAARAVVPQIRKAVEDAGRDPKSFPLVSLLYFSLDDDPDVAAKQFDEYVVKYYGRLGFDARGAGVYGGPDQAHERFAAYDELGIDELILVPTRRDPEQVDRLAELVRSYRKQG